MSSDVEVVLDALRREAAVWDEQADTVRDVAQAADRLHLSRFQAGVFQLLHDAHRDAVDHVTQRCREGAAALTDVADALRATADAYERGDAAVAERVTGTF